VKKNLFLLIMLFFAVFAWAEDDDDDDDDDDRPAQEGQSQPGGKRPGIRNRTFEISLANVSVGASNDFLTAKDFFQETLVINIDDLLNGFRLNLGAAIKPLSLNFNWKDRWGFGLDFAHIGIFGNLSLSGSMVSLETAEDDRFGAGMAVFVDVLGVPVFFHTRDDLKVKIRPAAFFPLLYTEPGITYNFDGSRLSVDYDMRVYTPISLEGILGGGALTDVLTMDTVWQILNNNLGFDLSLALEYPLYHWLDIGADIVNLPIPFAAPRLNHYTQLRDSLYVDSSKIDLADIIPTKEGEEIKIPDDAYHLPGSFQPEYGYDSGGKALYRPFKMLFYANYRPFDSAILTLMPSLGFSISRLYASIGSIEGGVSARLDLGNIFIATLGMNYTDRKWKHSLDLVLNFRAIELDVGVSLQSPGFLKSFQASGLGVNVGVKLGW